MVEILVAIGIGTAVIIASAIAFRAMVGDVHPTGNWVRVTLGAPTVQNFYGTNSTTVDVWRAPNSGRKVEADRLAALFLDDIGRASAVFCLARTSGTLNTVRPASITLPSGFQGQTVDRSQAFRSLLASAIPAAAEIFHPFSGASGQPNATVFVLTPSDSLTALNVRAVYDIDVIQTTSPQGSYVSVRRYQGGLLTDFYNVFFRPGSGAAFSPLVVEFERAARRESQSPTVADRLKVADKHPFYFLWWPDPAMDTLAVPAGATQAETSPRAAYPNMGGRTSLFFAIPMFPALL